MSHEFYEVQGANHNYYSIAWKREIIERTIAWLRTEQLPQQSKANVNRP